MKTFLKIMNMTVAMAEATIVVRAVKKEKNVRGRARRKMKVLRRCGRVRAFVSGFEVIDWGGREETSKGERKMEMKARTVPVRKRPNM